MVSVVIPTYNRESVITRAINSVLNQTYKDIELIIVDDCSRDNTRAVVEGISDYRLKYVCLPQNSGACAARNKGIKMAEGEYIAFQDSDDQWLPTKLQEQIELMQEKDIDISFCAFSKVNADGSIEKMPQGKESGFLTQKELVYDSLASTQTIVGKASVIKQVMFDESLPRMQDYDFIIRASELYKIYFLNKELVRVYEQSDSITASKKQYKKRLEITEKLLNKYPLLTKKYPEWNIRMLKIIAHCQVMLRENANPTLVDIYRQEMNAVNFIKIFLNRIGVLYLLFKIKE